MHNDYDDVVNHMSQFYSQAGKKLISRVDIMQKVLTERARDDYYKPPTPLYFKVQLSHRKSSANPKDKKYFQEE